MIVRIVRMHFAPANVDTFLQIFDAQKEHIRNVSGCSHLQLLKDSIDPACFATLSQWDAPESLENYRNSELFASVWARVKPLFSKRPEAFSLEKFIEL